MPSYGNQHITQISRVQLPEIAQDPDLGVKFCATPIPIVASETKTDRLYNDKKGVFVKRSDVNDTVTFTVEKDGVDIVPLGDYIGLPYDPLVVAFVIDWRQHLINHGAGCYRLRVNFDIAGVTREYYEGAYQLFPYGTHTVIETVRLFSYFDSFHSAKGINFKDSGFHSSIRFGGRFGNRQPNTEINNIKHTDNIQRKIRRENINSYELTTDPLTECFTRDILDFHLVGENEIYITDNDAMNHSYRYRDYPVILSDTPEMEHTSGRPSQIVATFEDKQLNEYTSYVSSQDPNVIEPPVCDPATVTVDNTDGTQVDSGTVPSGGSGTFIAPDGTVEVNKSDGTLIQSVTVVSNGLQPYNVSDSPITVNGSAFADVKATDALDIPVHNTAGNDVGSVGSGEYVIGDSDVTANGDAFDSVVAEGNIDVPIEDEDGNTLDTSVVGGVVQVFLYWYMIAVLSFRSRMINEGATFETPESLNDSLIDLGETEYDNALLVITPHGYSTGTLYSVKPQDGSGDFSYTQNTANGTRINENGEIEILPANTPRITWENGEPLILVEESRTNLVTYSDDFTQSDWTKAGSGTGVAPVITPNAAPSVFEGQMAQRVDFDRGAGNTNSDISNLLIDIPHISGNDYTGSMWIKAATPSDISKEIAMRPFATTNSVFVLTNEWQKVERTNTANIDNNIMQIFNRGGTTADNQVSLLLAGVQNEQASSASSSIQTNGATATRNDDIITNSNIQNFITDEEGSLYIEFYLTHFEYRNRYLYSFTNTGGEFAETFIRQEQSGDPRQLTFFHRNSLDPDQFVKTPNQVQLGLNKMMVNWSANEINISLNGQSNTLANIYNTVKSGFNLGRARIDSLFLNDTIRNVWANSIYTTPADANIKTTL